MKKTDKRFMQRAIQLAKKGVGRVKTNPLVGCVIVKDGKIVSEGYHHYFGGDHAEVDALKKMGFDARGCTLYTNLEPCCHHGKTAPCTDAIIASGVRKAVIAMEDPTEKVNCRGIGILKKNRIKVEVGVLRKEAEELNRVFLKNIREGMPFVAIKAAMSIDGKSATKKGDSKWITNEKSRKFVHKLRNSYDAVLVGINTVLIDDPWLNCRLRGGRDPLRVVLDTKLKIPVDANVLADGNVVVATAKGYDKRKCIQLRKKGAHVIVVEKDKKGRIDIKELMKRLLELNISSVLIEGGSEVNASALEAGVVDKCFFFIAPKIIGGRKAKGVVGGEGASFIKNASLLHKTTVKIIEGDVLVEGYVRRKAK